MTSRSWIRKLFGRPVTGPIHKAAARCRPSLECLEARIVPTEFHDVGGLRFLTPTEFESVDGTYRLGDPDSVSIGFAPGTGETFHPLLKINLTDGIIHDSESGVFILDPGKQTFRTSGELTMSLIDTGLPIFKQSHPKDGTFPIDQEFNISKLLGFGVTIDTTDAQPSTFPVVDWVDFQMTGLALSEDDTGGKVGMQGKGSISSATGADFSNIGCSKCRKVLVSGSDYVWADKDGITVTGLAGKLDFSSKGYEVGGYTVTGAVEVGYSDPGDGNKRISIGGHVELTAPTSETFKLENVGGTIAVSMGSENGSPKFYGLTLDVDGTFKAGGLGVTTLNDFGFSYNFDGPQWEVFGGIEFTIKDNAVVDILLGTDTDPGLVIKDGTLQKFNGTLNADIELGPVVITTSTSNGVVFEYDRDEGQFEMSGGVGIKVGKGDTQFTIAATLGDSTDPGIIYIPDQGGLQQANFGITGSLSVGSLSFSARDAGFRWVKATSTTAERWEIHGAYQVEFGAFDASVELGTTESPGIVVDKNGFQLDGITVH